MYAAPFDVRLKRNHRRTNEEITTVVQPDICVVCDLTKLDEKGCLGAPDLVIEILSPGNAKKEMRQKYEVYEESGVKEYWLVNMSDKTILCYRLDQTGKFIGVQPLTEDDYLTTPLFADMNIEVKKVFEYYDGV